MRLPRPARSLSLLLTSAALLGVMRAQPAALVHAQVSLCAVGRGALLRVSDPGASGVQRTPLMTSVAALNALPIPATLPATRLGPEQTTYSVIAHLSGATPLPDGTIALRLTDPVYPDRQIFAYLTDPAGCGAPSDPELARDIEAARDNYGYVVDTLRLGSQRDPIIVRVNGVGFFEAPGSHAGGPNNGLALGPVTAFTLTGPALVPQFPVLPPR